MMRKVTRYVDRLLRQRRPRPFVPTDEEAEALSAAIALRAARSEDALPRGEFLAALHGRLAEQAARAGEEDRAATGQPAATEQRSPRRRRGFLIGTAASAAAATVGAAAGRLLTGPGAVPTASSTLEPATGSWQTVLASAELAEGGTARFDTGPVTGYLTRTAGAVTARSGVCTHQGCRLNLTAGQLACPCHRTFFRLDGTVITSQLRTPPARLPALKVREQDGQIQVYLPEVS